MKSSLRFGLASLALTTAPAIAQPVTTPADVEPAPAPIAETVPPAPEAAPPSAPHAAALGVEVIDPERSLSIDDVRAAIGNELQVTTSDSTAFAPGLGRIEIAIERGVVRIAYHPAAGTVIERTLALPPDPQDRVALIAFVATNLVRDQAAEVLGGLPAVAPAPMAIAATATAASRRWVPATLGLIPPLTIDRAMGEHVAVGVGVHVLIGVTDEITLASISGIGDVVSGDMNGAQIGGIAAVTVRHARGLQLGGAAALARGSLFGVQAAGIAAAAGGRSTGLQVGGIMSAADDFYGIQVGGIGTVATQRIRGAQVGGIATVANDVQGGQIGGIVNVANRVNGLQIAGIANIGGDVRGIQIGTVNVARKMRGVQIGVINLSDDGDDSFPIGVINYSRNGGVAIDGWVDSSRVSAVGFRHGTKHVHNVWSVGWSPDHDNVLVGAGLGVSHRFNGSMGVDLTAMQWLTDIWDGEFGQINQLRASLSIPLGQSVEAFGGVAANVYVADVMEDNSENFHPKMARVFSPTESTTVVAWPSAFAGVRLRAR
ncbi:MAG: hypothetical protein AB7O24_14150 [Kofleriaceae bacterium]